MMTDPEADAARADVMDMFRRALADRPGADRDEQRELLAAIAHMRLSQRWEWRVRDIIGGPLEIFIIGEKR